jgi:hypothetical protein
MSGLDTRKDLQTIGEVPRFTRQVLRRAKSLGC